MFNRNRTQRLAPVETQSTLPSFFETLESRQLMSAAHHPFGGGHGGRHDGGGSEIAFSLAPTAVQTGLTSLASTDGVTAPTSTTEVFLGNRDGVETYSIHETGTGTRSTLTVDSAGDAVTAPTKTTTTFGEITDSDVPDEFTAIATALNLTAPASMDRVTVLTTSAGAATYTLKLTSTTTSGRTHSTAYTVDADGNVVGDARVPLSVLSAVIQDGLTGNAPAGATALTSTSIVRVHTVDGVTLYSVTYTGTGTRTTVSVDTSGALHSGTTRTSITYADLTATVAGEIQTLATAEGVTTTIDSTTKVIQTTEANGTVLFTIRLIATSTTDSSVTYPITITVDAAGNPTTLAGGSFGGGFGGRGGRC